MATLVLKQGRDKPVRQRHPWVFSGAVAHLEGDPAPGDVVEVQSADGCWLARGYFNPHSQIVVRLLTWDPAETIDAAFWRRRLQRAISARQDLLTSPQITACRLVHAESDGLPGLVVDRYGDWLVVQFLTLGVEVRRELLTALLMEMWTPQGIYERSDVDVRSLEGLSPRTGVLAGQEPPDLVEILEYGHRFLVDVKRGQKTGFYLDQRENRRLAASYCTGRTVLNAFAYTGAFGVYAAAHGAGPITHVETSADALALARRNMELNGYGGRDDEYVTGDAFQVLRRYREAGRRFGVVILDPPKFAHTQAQVSRAARGYKDINMLALQLLEPGGFLVTFSCSGRVSVDLFQKIVFAATVDAGRDAQIVWRLSQGPDHPVLLTFPEGEYLKGFVCRVW